MKEQTALDLTLDLFRLTKRIPHPRLRLKAVDGLTRTEVELLLVLAMNCNEDKTSFSATEISQILQITPAGVTHLLNPLQEMGFIERLHHAHDRRVVLVQLTDKGKETADDITADVHRQLMALITYLGEDDSRTLVRLVAKCVDFLMLTTES